MHSALYRGTVTHRRLEPRPHAFRYGLFLMYVDLDELPRLFDGRWLWSVERPNVATFRRSDFLGDPRVPLADAVRERVAEASGTRPSGPVRVLTNLRYWGYSFNPVTFYYVFDPAGHRVEHVVAEITNTPWDERHAYVLHASGAGEDRDVRARFPKTFHVSPFFDMDLEYAWRFSEPGDALAVHMQNLDGGRPVFSADLRLERHELGAASLAHALLRYPAQTLKVSAAIYWQAFRLWRKRTPFFTHPAKRAGSPVASAPGTPGPPPVDRAGSPETASADRAPAREGVAP